MITWRRGVETRIPLMVQSISCLSAVGTDTQKDKRVGIGAMTFAEKEPGSHGRLYSWRKTLAFFVVAAMIGWAGVFGAIYATLAVLDLFDGPDIAQEVNELQKIAPAAGSPSGTPASK